MSKKKLKILISAIFFAVGILMIIIGMTTGAKTAYKNQVNITDINSTVDVQGIASLNIDVKYADLEISASTEAEKIEISAENISRDYLNYNTSNNIFNFTYKTNKWYEIITVPNINNHSGKISITIPADMTLQDIQINSSLGALSINYLSVEKIYIYSGLSANTINSVNADYLEINCSLGDVSASNLNCKELKANGSLGNAEFINVHTTNAEISSSLGDVTLSGSIAGDSYIDCGMGDITADIYGSIDDYSINIIDGKAIINGKKMTGHTKGKNILDIQTGSGDVSIDFK